MIIIILVIKSVECLLYLAQLYIIYILKFQSFLDNIMSYVLVICPLYRKSIIRKDFKLLTQVSTPKLLANGKVIKI